LETDALDLHHDELLCVPHGIGFGASRPTTPFERRLVGLSPPFAHPAVQHDGRSRRPATGGAQNMLEHLLAIPSNDDESEELRHAFSR
jgi:hypothetical protein